MSNNPELKQIVNRTNEDRVQSTDAIRCSGEIKNHLINVKPGACVFHGFPYSLTERFESLRLSGILFSGYRYRVFKVLTRPKLVDLSESDRVKQNSAPVVRLRNSAMYLSGEENLTNLGLDAGNEEHQRAVPACRGLC